MTVASATGRITRVDSVYSQCSPNGRAHLALALLTLNQVKRTVTDPPKGFSAVNHHMVHDTPEAMTLKFRTISRLIEY